jgi:hypothetical protein
MAHREKRYGGRGCLPIPAIKSIVACAILKGQFDLAHLGNHGRRPGRPVSGVLLPCQPVKGGVREGTAPAQGHRAGTRDGPTGIAAGLNGAPSPAPLPAAVAPAITVMAPVRSAVRSMQQLERRPFQHGPGSSSRVSHMTRPAGVEGGAMSVAGSPPGQVRFNGVLLPRSLWPPGRASSRRTVQPSKSRCRPGPSGRPIGRAASPAHALNAPGHSSSSDRLISQIFR